MDQRVPILVALICFSSPSLGRSWFGHHDQHPAKKYFAFKPYHFDPDYHGPNQDPSSDYDSSSEEFWDRNDNIHRENANEYGSHHGYNHDHHNEGNHGFDYRNHESHAFGRHHGNGHNYEGDDNHRNFRFDHGDHEIPAYNNPAFGHHNTGNIPNNQGQEHFNDNDKHGQNSQRPQSSQANNDDANGNPRVVDLNDGSPNVDPSNSGSPHSGSPAPDLPQISTEQGFVVDADRVVFPDSKQAPITSSPLGPIGLSTLDPLAQASSLDHSTLGPVTHAPLQDPTMKVPTTEVPAITGPTPELLYVLKCIRACPVTPEYNPVCGSNNVTYNNPGILQCARNCGVDVSVARQAPCPPPMPPLLKLVTDNTNINLRAKQAAEVNVTPPQI